MKSIHTVLSCLRFTLGVTFWVSLTWKNEPEVINIK